MKLCSDWLDSLSKRRLGLVLCGRPCTGFDKFWNQAAQITKVSAMAAPVLKSPAPATRSIAFIGL